MSDNWTDYTLRDSELSGLWLQPGFVEGIVPDRKHFDSLAAAYQHIFRHNPEYAILLWNGIPVRLDYPRDLSRMVSNLIAMLVSIQQVSGTGISYAFQTPNLHTIWQVDIEIEQVTVQADWQRVNGHYEQALNQIGIVRMPRLAFLCEWKMLLQQLIRTISDSEVILTQDDVRTELERLRILESGIPGRGRFYRY